VVGFGSFLQVKSTGFANGLEMKLIKRIKDYYFHVFVLSNWTVVLYTKILKTRSRGTEFKYSGWQRN
jgi:hypothetical protein